MARARGDGSGRSTSHVATPANDAEAGEPMSDPHTELPRSPRGQAARMQRLTAAGDLNPAWQRWTVDELFEGRARVLVSLARQPLESTAAEARRLAPDQARQRVRLRDAVVGAETASPTELWGPEVATYVNSRTLQRFLQRRTDVPALPDARALREGDVFWVVQPMDAALHSPVALLRDAQPDVEVWDVTAAARQAAKRTYDEAVRASEGALSRG